MQIQFTQIKKKLFFFKTLISIVIFLLITTSIYSQNYKFHIPDSLKNKSYKELFLELDIFNSKPVLAKIYANAYLNKARREKNTIKMASGYSQLASLAGRNYNYKTVLTYCDSIISLTKNSRNSTYPGYGFMVKGDVYFTLGKYKNALTNYLKAQNYALKYKNNSQLLYIKNGIGQLKIFWGNYNEATNIFKSQLKDLDKLNLKKLEYDYLYETSIYNLSNAYLLNHKLDSAKYYTDLGIKTSLKQYDTLTYYDFISQNGIIYYYKKQYHKSLENLNNALPFNDTNNNYFNTFYYKGKIFSELHKPESAFKNFKKADSIYNLSKDITPEIRDIQLFFINYYKNHKDSKNQLKYIDKLLQVDSVITQNKKYISETIVKKYDRPTLLKEKEKIIKNLHEKERKSSILIIGLSILIIISIGLFVKYYQKQELYKKQFKKLILAKKTQIKPILTDKKITKLQGISIQIIEQILKNLENFELNNEFINNNLTLNMLAKTLETNSNYLSKIINFYKEKNYSNYISDLRIDYCIKKLKEDTIFRKYAIKAIASEVGFNNTESFSKAFFIKTGIYPSFFIKNLNKISI